MTSTESKKDQSKGLIYILFALCILAYPVYYFSQPNCNRASDTLLTLLSRDNFSEVNSLEASYKPNLKILDTTRMYSKGDKVVCSAKVNIQVSDEIANRIEELRKKYRIGKDEAADFEYLPLLKSTSWNFSNRGLSTEVTYEVGANDVSIGSGDGAMSIAQYYSIVLTTKKIYSELNKPATLSDINVNELMYKKINSGISDSYSDVPKPVCDEIPTGVKNICSNEKIMNVLWFTRRIQIWAEENATRSELDHKSAYPYCANQGCLDYKSIGKVFMQSLENAGYSYWLEN